MAVGQGAFREVVSSENVVPSKNVAVEVAPLDSAGRERRLQIQRYSALVIADISSILPMEITQPFSSISEAIDALRRS